MTITPWIPISSLQGIPWLTVLGVFPLSVALLSLSGWDARRQRRGAMALMIASILLSLLPIVARAQGYHGTFADATDPGVLLRGSPWFRVDELSLFLLPFANFLWFVVVLATPRAAISASMLRRGALSTCLTLCTFMSRDPLPLAVFWTLSVLTLLWDARDSQKQRVFRLASRYLGLATLSFALGCLLLHSELQAGRPASTTSCALIMIGVLVRKGIVPLHSWLPELFQHGKINAAVLFSAPQGAAYAAMVLLLPYAPAQLLTLVGVLALLTAIYGALAALTQVNARRAVGYLFVSQSALVLVGVDSTNVEGLTGSLCLWLSSGIAFAGLTLTVWVLEARRGELPLNRLHGGYDRMPLLASTFLLLGLACVGFPGSLGFVGNELLLDGAVSAHPYLGFAVVATAALTGIGVLRMYFSLFCGTAPGEVNLRFGLREKCVFYTLFVVLVLTGLSPGTIVKPQSRAAQAGLSQRLSYRQLPGRERH